MNDSSGQHLTRPRGNDADDRLDSWKEIATYLDRTVTTVKRWENEEGLPVLRHVHNKQATSLPHPNPPNLHHSNPHPIRTLALFVVLRQLG